MAVPFTVTVTVPESNVVTAFVPPVRDAPDADPVKEGLLKPDVLVWELTVKE